MPPIAIAAAAPTARVSVATAMITNIRKAREDDLVDQRAADADARDRRPELGGLTGPDRKQDAAPPRSAPAHWAAM